MNTTAIRKRALYLVIAAVIISLLILVVRGEFVSNTLKDFILPELEDITGQKVTVQKLYLNLFPLFIEANGLKVADGSGRQILYSKKVKGYIDLTGILSRHITLRRLLIQEPAISADRVTIEKIISAVQAYLKKEREPSLKVKIKAVDVANASVNLRDLDARGTLGVKGFSGEALLGENQRIKASIKELNLEKEGWPNIKADLDAAVTFKKERIEIQKFRIGSYGSRFKGEGVCDQGKGTVTTEIALLVDSVKRFLHLSQRGDGTVSAKGEIRLENPGSQAFDVQLLKNIFVDLNLSGDFYLETLMEILKVKEKLTGLIDFKGEVTGRLPDISAKGTARLRNGALFGVDLNSLTCTVLYKDGEMKFADGFASLYNGTAKVDASLKLPVVDFYAVNVVFKTVDSVSALKLIGWVPPIPAGKVDGELSTSGSAFNPDGRFVYTAFSPQQWSMTKGYQPRTENILDRIKDSSGSFSLRGDMLSLSDVKLHTPISNIALNGTIDLAKKVLAMKGSLSTSNVADLSLPYYREIKGKGEFSGEISGVFDNPKITGKARLVDAIIEEYGFESITSDFSYEKSILNVLEAVFRSRGEEHTVTGTVHFPEAKELFELARPVYDLKAFLRHAEFGKTVQIFYRAFPGTGRMNADVTIGGKDKDISISGKGFAEKASVYSIPFDSGSAVFSYDKSGFSMKQVKILRGKSALIGEGKLSDDKRFSYTASSDKIFLKDTGLPHMPEDAVISLQTEGHGTFDDPAITLNAKVVGGTLGGINLGGGTINAAIRNRDISLTAALLNERVKVKGTGRFDDNMTWSADVSLQPGRYDFLVSSFLKDVPEDLQLNLDGRIQMKGDRSTISAAADISHLTLSLFGQTFSNDSPIQLLMQDRKLSLTAFTFKSGTTSFRLQGGMELGREYDVVIDGTSSLAPLKGLSNKIGYLKGDADFVFSLRGKWADPEINGGMTLTNASFGLRDYPGYISAINGYFYIDGDRIVVQKLSGKFGGGDVRISGLVYLKAFQATRFYLEAAMDNITISPAKDFSVNFEGNLLYKGTAASQSITGDIKINKSRYREMVEWRSWLLTPRAKEKPKADETVFEKAELNISLSGENISIDNNVARASVSIGGDMIVKGKVSSPVLLGRLESKEGYVYFRNNEFRIIFASADFSDPKRIKPVFNLTAEALVKGYNIRLNLEGQTDRFSLTLSSDPYLEESDILALITVGQVGKQLKGLEGGIGAGEATSFITGKVQDVLEERLRSITGLDRFQVEPSVSPTTGTVSPKITVSKRLIGDRLFVTYSNLLGTAEEQVVKLEYLLDRNISLIGIRDEQGGVGGDVKFRFEFK